MINIKHIIKGKIIKPCYRVIYYFSPKIADGVREYALDIYENIRCKKIDCVYEHNPGLLIDMTAINSFDAGTGIQRVVNNIFNNVNSMFINVTPIVEYGENFILAREYLKRRYKKNIEQDMIVNIVDGDKLLLLDSSWSSYKAFSYHLDKCKVNNIKSYAVIYDLFPIQYPELFDSNLFIDNFTKWHNMIIEKCDCIMCISKSTADIVYDYAKKHIKRDDKLELTYFHLGSRIEKKDGIIREEIKSFVKNKNTFLMVGTVEPRKGHYVVLEAFEKLNNLDIGLLILGHNGWKNTGFKEKMSTLIKKGLSILWIDNASDEEIQWAYKNTSALIAASKDEGFGLPIVEAAYFGLPIICSDIPIFHEVSQEYADFFKAMDSNHLCEVISNWINTKEHPDSSKIKLYSWQESAQEVLDIINGKTESYKVINE